MKDSSGIDHVVLCVRQDLRYFVPLPAGVTGVRATESSKPGTLELLKVRTCQLQGLGHTNLGNTGL